MNSSVRLVASALLIGSIRAVAGEPAVPPKVEFDPAPDKELLARIAALPDNTWLKLPKFKVAGDIAWCSTNNYNAHNMVTLGPSIRGYSVQMAWAPERKRALYCGANHQAPHYLNDVWEYDLAANTWTCLCPPDTHFNPSEAWVKANVVVTNGVATTRRGGPIRPCHTWDGLCYDAERRRLLWLDPARGLIFGSWDKVVAALGADLKPEDAKLKPAPWIFEFDPAARKWDSVWTGIPDAGEACVLEYLPDRKAFFLKGGTRPCGTQLYEPEKKAWKPLSSKGQPGYGSIGAYSPDHKAVVVVNSDSTSAYSLDTNEWKPVQPKAPIGARDCTGVFTYDPVAKLFVLYTVQGERKADCLWLYDLAKNEWTDPKPQGDVPPAVSAAGYHDPERNVSVFYTHHDVYVYRCKRKAE